MPMPRNHYVKTRTGVIIGCAAFMPQRPVVDEHTTLVQQVLLKQYSNPKHAKWLNWLYVAFVLAMFAAAFWFATPTVSVK